MAKKYGGCLGNRAYERVAQFTWRGSEDRPTAPWAESGIVDEIGYKGLGLKNDVLLTACLFFLRGP
jgi:hypothetical protein